MMQQVSTVVGECQQDELSFVGIERERQLEDIHRCETVIGESLNAACKNEIRG